MHKGRILSQSTMEELENNGISLMQYVKQQYHYRADRVGRALRELTGEED